MFSTVLFRIKLVAVDVIFSSQIFKDADEFANVKLEHMNFIATLGVGGFGRVELVSRVSLIILFICSATTLDNTGKTLCPRFLFFHQMITLNNYEKCFLLHLKNAFRSRFIQFCLFSSPPDFPDVIK